MEHESSAIESAKRRKLSIIQSQAAFKMEHESSAIESAKRPPRVCVVSHCLAAESKDDDEFIFYIVNCDSSSGGGDEYTHMEPKFRYKSGKKSPPVTFCAVKSTNTRPAILYMFEGDDHRSPEGRVSKGPRFAGKFVITDDIYGRSDCTILEKKDLRDIKVMHANKYSVKALPTPDGKSILVFSSEITWTDNGVFGDSFELYDVDNDSWENLPGFPSKRRCSRYFLPIKSYGFDTDSRFLIQTENEAFVLDLKASTKEWEVSLDLKIPLASGYFVGIGGVYFTPEFAYDSKDRGQMHRLPQSRFPRDAYGTKVPRHITYPVRVFPYITSLGREHGVCDIGVLRARCHPHYMTIIKNLRVILDIYCADIDKYRRDKEEYKKRDKEEGEEPALDVDTIGPKKTIKFMIDYDFYTYFLGQMYLFSV